MAGRCEVCPLAPDSTQSECQLCTGDNTNCIGMYNGKTCLVLLWNHSLFEDKSFWHDAAAYRTFTRNNKWCYFPQNFKHCYRLKKK